MDPANRDHILNSQIARIHSQLLVLRYRRGDDNALTDLVAMWEKPLFYYIRRLVTTEDDAWDALQETWIRAVRGIGKLKNPESFPSWLYRVARNATSNFIRDNHRMESLSDKEIDLDAAGQEANRGFSAADAALIHRGLQQLPLAQREVLTLFFLEDFSLEEISSITGIATGTVKSRLYYAKKALRNLIEKEGSDDE
jgi:RNA polymerase sigma factor (sigma-70 family)